MCLSRRSGPPPHLLFWVYETQSPSCVRFYSERPGHDAVGISSLPLHRRRADTSFQANTFLVYGPDSPGVANSVPLRLGQLVSDCPGVRFGLSKMHEDALRYHSGEQNARHKTYNGEKIYKFTINS